jgi:hypothetical protein
MLETTFTPATAATVRHCPRCDKRLTRLNPGPWCYACQESAEMPLVPRRTRRARLPHDAIIALYREIGDTTRVAHRLGLARSSVWYVVERAKKDGRLADAEPAA